MSPKSLLLVLLPLLAVVSVNAQIPTEVVELTAYNFEYMTQAATGQTTGIWFVLFNSPASKRSAAASTLWKHLAAEEEKTVIYGETDLGDQNNRKLAYRFIDIQPPLAVLFKDRKMYVFNYPLHLEDTPDKIATFLEEGYLAVKAREVPPVPTEGRGKEIVDAATSTSWKQVVVGIVLLASGMWFKTWAQRQDELRRIAAAKKARQQQQEQQQQGSKDKGADKEDGEKKGEKKADKQGKNKEAASKSE